MKKQTLLLLAIVLFIALPMVMAMSFNQSISPQDQSTFDQILLPVMTIYNLIKYIASAIAGIALLFSGITYITSGNDTKKRENAKNMTMYVVIGLVVIWAAPLVVQLIIG